MFPNEPVEYPYPWGFERSFTAKGEKSYRTQLVTGVLKRRMLKRRFKTAGEAQDYGWRFIFRYRKMCKSSD